MKFRPRFCLSVIIAFLSVSPVHAAPESVKDNKQPAKEVAAKSASAPPDYQPQLLRLSEILGALSYLKEVCAPVKAGPSLPTALRDQMKDLLNSEEGVRKELLTSAFNRGFYGYAAYRQCSPNARLAIARFQQEGGRLAHEISTYYRAN